MRMASGKWNRIWPLLSEAFLCCLLLCAASGLLLAFHYRPEGDVARCVEETTSLAPFGLFFRRLHYFSAQACALLALVHVLRYLLAGAAGRVVPSRWIRLIGALAACFALLLTGFMLKGDAEAVNAATVLRGLAESVPGGEAMSGVLAGRGDGLLHPPYVLHCLVLPPVLSALMRAHVRNWIPGWRRLAATGLALSLWCLAVPLPLPASPQGGGETTGPWFLMGLQQMLRHGSPLVAGVVVPGGFLALVAFLPLLRGRLAAWGRGLVLAGTCCYAALALGLAW